MILRPEVMDEILKTYNKPEDLLGPEGILKQLSAQLVSRVLEGEMSHHLGYEKHESKGRGSGNNRNGKTDKTLVTDKGTMKIKVPRDRNSTFEPALVGKHQRRFDGFDDQVVSLYTRGMTVRDIQEHLKNLYAVDVSPDLISQVTNEVLAHVKEWQQRPLDAIYPIVFLDALVVKVRDQGVVANKSVYVALGVNLLGVKEVLGLWIAENEGAKFWLKILNELHTRGLQDIFVACCDGLKGFPDAIETVFPKTIVQTCIVHMIRNSFRWVSYQDRREVAADLKPIYTAGSTEDALDALAAFEGKWKNQYPMIAESWQKNWERVTPFLDFPPDIRKAIYTTNAIESINYQLRKCSRNRGHFPSDDAVLKLLYLNLQRAEKKWTMPIRNWKRALNQFAVFFEGRVPL